MVIRCVAVVSAPARSDFLHGAPIRLEALGDVICHGSVAAPHEYIDRRLPCTIAIIGQATMPCECLDRAPNLRAIMNLGGHFMVNIDCDQCFARNIHCLVFAPVFAPLVAAMAMELVLTRGIVEHDTAFRCGEIIYSDSSNRAAPRWACVDAPTLAVPFAAGQTVHRPTVCNGPWLHDHVIEKPGAQPAGLRQRMSGSDVLLILSAATDANQRMIGAEKLVMMTPGARVVLVWRAHLVDCDVLPDAADQGRIRAVIVYPGQLAPANACV
ncbi:MAG: NAD(P)-dependent oxidoreductase [Pirellulaceae bacterium]|nr:NAD(P)-dependent oxidoreductase [Pirellulaceae bacterium]MDP7347020.1 NAD(P)-dependent oxidoreductase [Phycisphaeraceae bacterium]